MSNRIFRIFHTTFKNAMQIKPLIYIDRKRIINQNVLHIFTAMIDDLSNDIAAESNSELNKPSDNLRLKAMHLALAHEESVTLEHLHSLVRNVKRCEDKLTKLINLVEKYENFRMEPIMFYIYFKVLNYLAHVYGDKIKNSKMAVNYLKVAKKMYDALTGMAKLQSSGYYDTVHLFTKSTEMKRMAVADEQIEQLHSNNLRMMQILYADLNDMDNYFKIVHLMLQRQRSTTIENGSAPVNWVFQIDNIVANLLELERFQHAAAYLLIALNVLQNHNNELDTKKWNDLHFNLVKHWILYNLLLFNYSRKNSTWRQRRELGLSKEKQSGDDDHDDAAGDTLTSVQKRDTHTTKRSDDCNICGDFDDEVYFMNFDSLRLSESERSLCRNSLRNVSDARRLFNYTITLVELLLQNEELINEPIDYVTVNYQLSDLYALMLVFDDDTEITHNYQNNRQIAFEKMMKNLNETHSDIFHTLKAQMICDYNEILMDMLLNNLNRLSFDTNTKSQPQFDLSIKEEKFKEKLAELKCLNNSIASASG